MHRLSIVYTTLVLVAMLVMMLPSHAQSVHAASQHSVRFADPGHVTSVPVIVTERLALPESVTVHSVAPATAHRIERFFRDFMPCMAMLTDEVIVLEQPFPSAGQDDSMAVSGFLTGVSSVEKRDSALPYSPTNLIVKLYLFLPPALLDGTGLDRPMTSANVIPYAAPVPATYGESLDWALAHEAWHLIDIHARLDVIRDRSPDSPELLGKVLNDPSLWAETFPWIGVSALLGMADSREFFVNSDELDRTYTLTRGATRYQHRHGIFTVHYDDGVYAFERRFTRAGYLPDELRRLSDLAPLLRSGRFPTLYALFNTDDERFAEFGAWWWFITNRGGSDRFAQLYPSLHTLYSETLQTASRRCESSSGTVARAPSTDGIPPWNEYLSNHSPDPKHRNAPGTLVAAMLPWGSRRPQVPHTHRFGDRV